MSSMRRFIPLMIVLGSTACAPLVRPVVDHRGFVPDEGQLETIKVGVDSKLSVSSRLGTPSTAGDFNGETWYYISSDQELFTYHRPKIVKQEIVAIHFDQNDVVSDVRRYGIEDGRVVDFVKRETPTRGKELSLLQQLLGNVGSAGALGDLGENEQGPRRGGER